MQLWNGGKESLPPDEYSEYDFNSPANPASMLEPLLQGKLNIDTRNIDAMVSERLLLTSPFFILLRINCNEYLNRSPSSLNTNYYTALSSVICTAISGYIELPHKSYITGIEGSFYIFMSFECEEDILTSDIMTYDLNKWLEPAIDYLLEEYDIEISIVISSIYKGLSYISRSYAEVCDIHEYCRLMGLNYHCMTPDEAEFCQRDIDLIHVELDLFLEYRTALQKSSFIKAGEILSRICDGYLCGLSAVRDFRGKLISELRLAYLHLESIDNSFSSKHNTYILNEYEVYAVDTLIEIKARIADTFSYLEEKYQSISQPPKTALSDIISYIESNYVNYNLSTTMICDAFNISPAHLYRLFQRCETSVLAYIHVTRLKAAKELLLDTNLTIDEISRMVGFSGRWSLIRSFKRYEGTTPTQYRVSGQINSEQ